MQAYKAAMAAHSEHVCSGNFWWQNLDDDSDRKHVPLNVKRINTIVDHFFTTPNRVPNEITLAVQTKTEDPHFGKLYVLSPIEFTHAFIMAVHRDLKKNDPDTLAKWYQCMLMTPFRFTVCVSKDSGGGGGSLRWTSFMISSTPPPHDHSNTVPG
jgi:hypothetical protein